MTVAEPCIDCGGTSCDHEPCEVIFTCSDVENGAHYRRCEFTAGHEGGHKVGEFIGVPYVKRKVTF